MKKYTAPKIEITVIRSEDIVSVSGGSGLVEKNFGIVKRSNLTSANDNAIDF